MRGVKSPLDVEERLANSISDSIAPRLVPEIEILPWRRTHVIAITVFPSATRPHHLTREGERAGTYVRVGSTNRRADEELINELRRFARGEAFDEQPMPELDSEALHFRAASESFAPVRRLARCDLETLRLLTMHQGRLVPTVGVDILFGKERERQFPDAWIQAGRFAGQDKSRIIDQAEVRSLPVQAVEEAIAFIARHSVHGAAIGPVRRTETWNPPPAAVREAVINAVVHTDYAQHGAPIRVSIFDDRLEVENPGLLPFGLTIADISQRVSKLRNRVIGRVFHALGLIEQWGSGIQRMSAACREAGLEPPVFEELATRFRVTIKTTPGPRFTRDQIDDAILAVVSSSEGLLTSEIANAIIIYIRAWQGCLYLAVVMDLCSRKIVGWFAGPTIRRDLVLNAVLMAARRRHPRGTVIHSDQGTRYGSDAWLRFCRSSHLEPSTSRKGNCWDNAVAECFFSSLKKERIKKPIYKNPELALADVADYIDTFYSRTRRHSHLGGMSPEQFEAISRADRVSTESWELHHALPLTMCAVPRIIRPGVVAHPRPSRAPEGEPTDSCSSSMALAGHDRTRHAGV